MTFSFSLSAFLGKVNGGQVWIGLAGLVIWIALGRRLGCDAAAGAALPLLGFCRFWCLK